MWVSSFAILMSVFVGLSAHDRGANPSTKKNSAKKRQGKAETENHDPFLEEAKVFLGPTEGINLRKSKNGQWSVRGKVHRSSDAERVAEFLKRNHDVDDNTEIAKEAQEQLKKRLKQKLKSLHASGEILSAGKGRFVLVGNESPSVLVELQQEYPYIEFSSNLAAAPSTSSSAKTPQPSVLLELVLVEVMKSAFEKLGMHSQGNLSTSAMYVHRFLPQSQSLAMFGADPLKTFLDFALQNGQARIYAKEAVLAENDQVGEFQVGGEFPVKVSGVSSSVTFKDYGLILKFRPHLLRSALVHLDLESEISELDLGSVVDGTPSLTKKRLKTQLTTKLDEMIAIGGVVRCSQAQMKDKIPGLSAIPGIGRFFESDDFKRNRSEAYIFVTPRKLSTAWNPTPEF